MPPLTIAATVITRNRPSILRQCLEHLQRQSVTPDEIIVVDSSDNRGSFEVCGEFPAVTCVPFPNGRHQMPRARNLALLHSSSEVIAYIDDDCLVDPDWLAHLRQTYLDHAEAAGVGGRITDPRWRYDPAQPIGGVDECGRITNNFCHDPGNVCRVEILPGGNMSFRRQALEEAGGFDPSYACTNHREDHDLCVRIRRGGGALLYQPAAHAVHLAARYSAGELKSWHEFFLRYSFTRNDTYFVIKNFAHSRKALCRTLWWDHLVFLQQIWRSRSVLVLATVPVYLAAKLVGSLVGCRHWLQHSRGKRPNYLHLNESAA